MKKLFKSVLFVAAAAMTFAACNKVDVEQQVNEEDFYYTFALGSPMTKSLLSSDENGKFGAWENGDRLGTAIDAANPGYAYVTTTTTPTTFRIYKKGGLSGGEKVYAYYPYNSAAASVSEIPFEIPAGQSQDGANFDFDAMPMVAEEFVVPASYASTENNTEVGEISLINLGSVIDFQVYSSSDTYAAETILSVKFTAATPIAGSFSKDITSVKFDTESTLAISGFSGTEVVTSVANAPAIGADRDNAAHVYMVVAPTSGVTGSVVVKTNKAEYTYSLSTAQTFKRAGLKSFGLNLGTCANRVAEEINTTSFVFNTAAGIQALGLELPAASNGTNVERVVSDYIVLEGAKGGNETYYPRVWNSSGTYNFRVNKNNTITFSITGGTIKGIAFAAGSNFNLTTTEGTLTGTTWEGTASSVTFTNTDVNRTDINTITVSYTGGTAPVIPEYNITINGTTNGTVTASAAKATAGTEITLTVTPDSGYELDALTVVDADDNAVTVTNNKFSMPESDVTVSATFKEEDTSTTYYVKVTSTSDLTDGDYLIVYEDGNVAFNGGLETLDAVSNTISVTIASDNKIESTATTDAAKFTYDATAKTLVSASGYSIGQTSDANGLKSSNTDTYENTISFATDGSANIVSGGAYLRYNSASNQARFRYYKSSSYTNQKAIALYKKN